MSEQPQYSSFAGFQESTGSTAVTEEAVRDFITGKAGADEDFRAALLKDPVPVVEAEIGIKMARRTEAPGARGDQRRASLGSPGPGRAHRGPA